MTAFSLSATCRAITSSPYSSAVSGATRAASKPGSGDDADGTDRCAGALRPRGAGRRAAHRRRGRRRRHVHDAGEVGVDPAPALGPGVRVGRDTPDVGEGRPGPSSQHEGDRHQHLAQQHEGEPGRQGVERGGHAALDGVLDRDDREVRALGPHGLQRRDDVDLRQVLRLVRTGDLPQRGLGEGARRARGRRTGAVAWGWQARWCSLLRRTAAPAPAAGRRGPADARRCERSAPPADRVGGARRLVGCPSSTDSCACWASPRPSPAPCSCRRPRRRRGGRRRGRRAPRGGGRGHRPALGRRRRADHAGAVGPVPEGRGRHGLRAQRPVLGVPGRRLARALRRLAGRGPPRRGDRRVPPPAPARRRRPGPRLGRLPAVRRGGGLRRPARHPRRGGAGRRRHRDRPRAGRGDRARRVRTGCRSARSRRSPSSGAP